MNPEDQPSVPGPSRGQLIALFSGLAALGLLLGVGAAQLTGSGSDTDTALSGSTPADSPTAVSTSPQSTDAAEPTPIPSGIPDYRPIPVNAAAEPSLDFGFLTRVVSNNGAVTLRFDRASFFTGEAAKAHNQGITPDNDYLIENTNPAQRSFELDPQASIIAASRLLNQPGPVGRETLTVAEFVQNATRVLTGSTSDLPVWVRHTDGLSGPVTALAEQFLP